MHNGARAAVVNRTHRVVREQALARKEHKKRTRSLWLPIAICSPLLLIVCYGIYEAFETGEYSPTGVADGSGQLLLLMVWLLPITVFLIGITWFRRMRAQQERN